MSEIGTNIRKKGESMVPEAEAEAEAEAGTESRGDERKRKMGREWREEGKMS